MLVAQRRTAEQEILCCEKELAAYEARTELLPLSRDLNARRVALAEQEIKQWQEIVNRRRQQEAEQQARQAAWEAGPGQSGRTRVGQEERRTGRDAETVGRSASSMPPASWNRSTSNLTELKEQFKPVREKVEAAGKTNATNTIGLLLRKQRESLPNLRVYRRNIARPAADDRRGRTGVAAIVERTQGPGESRPANPGSCCRAWT